MEQFIGCDAHKKFSVFAAINEEGEYGTTLRISHDLETFRAFLKDLPPGSKIALETSGCYYWMVDEMERAGHIPKLAHAYAAKRRMKGGTKPTSGMPEVWRCCCAMGHCRRSGFRRRSCATSGRCCAGGCVWCGCERG